MFSTFKKLDLKGVLDQKGNKFTFFNPNHVSNTLKIKRLLKQTKKRENLPDLIQKICLNNGCTISKGISVQQLYKINNGRKLESVAMRILNLSE